MDTTVIESEPKRYICKECGDTAFAPTIDVILEREKLCLHCIKVKRESKRMNTHTNNALARSLSKRRLERENNKQPNKAVYVCNACGHTSVPLPTKPVRCTGCKTPGVDFHIEGTPFTTKMVLKKMVDSGTMVNYVKDIVLTLKSIADELPSIKNTATLEELSQKDSILLLTHLDTEHLDVSTVLAEQRLLVLSANLASTRFEEDKSNLDQYWENMYKHKIDQIDAILAILPTSMYVNISQT